MKGFIAHGTLPILGRDGALRRHRRRAKRQTTEPNAGKRGVAAIRSARYYAGGDIAARCPYRFVENNLWTR